MSGWGSATSQSISGLNSRESRVKEMINSTQSAFEKMKSEIQDKDNEIQRLKKLMDKKQFYLTETSNSDIGSHRRIIISELDYLISNARVEISGILQNYKSPDKSLRDLGTSKT
jgi:hypothetical protein